MELAVTAGSSDESSESSQYVPVLSVRQEVPFRSRIPSDLLQRIIDDDFRRSVSSYHYDQSVDNKCQEISSALLKGSSEFERPNQATAPQSFRTKDILKHLSPRYNEKYRNLLKHIGQWKPRREALIRNLMFFINKLDKTSKASTMIRFFSSTVDVTGSVGGLMFRSETGWASHALNAASFCGLCGLFSTVAEVEVSKRILDEVTESIENDHKLLEPIVRCFEEMEELDSIVQELFPHGIDKEIVQQIQEDSAEQDSYLKVFKAALFSNGRKDTNLLRNKDFLHSLQLFARSEVAPLWWNRIIYRRHPIILDFSRMALQMEFGQLQSIIFQCIPALPLEQQRLASLPVAGRIMLNLLTMCDSFKDLRKGAKSMHSDKLRKQLLKMKTELEDIDATIVMMKPQSTASIRPS